MDFDRHDCDMFLAYDEKSPWYPEESDELEVDQIRIVEDMQADFSGRSVLEIACGGGHWAHRFSSTTQRVVGVDISDRRVAFAKEKGALLPNVDFIQGSAYALDDVPGEFTAAYAVAWFSHVPTSRHEEFLTGLHHRIGGSGGIVYLIDESENDETAFRIDGEPDLYKQGKLASGDTFTIVDNCYNAEYYMENFAPYGKDLRIHIEVVPEIRTVC